MHVEHNATQYNATLQLMQLVQHYHYGGVTVLSVDLTVTTLRAPLTLPLSVGSKTSKQAHHPHHRHIVVISSIIMSSYHRIII